MISLPAIAALIALWYSNSTNNQQPKLPQLAIAARLCGASVPLINKPGAFIWIDSKMLYDQSVAQAKSLMDEEIWTKSYSEGQSLPLGTVINDGIQALRKIVSLQPDLVQVNNHDPIQAFQ